MGTSVNEVLGGEGVWVGVKLDEPLGKNNGTIKGRQFFECQANYGVMVRIENVNIDGEFPERGLDDSSDEDEI